VPNIAIVDVETTGLFPQKHDRVVEVACVVIATDGSVMEEFDSLVNPERDIGPTRIHGLCSSDVVSAPRFRDLAGHLVDVFQGCVTLAGHNFRFDRSFLSAEFQRLGFELPQLHTICTLQLCGGGSLSACCSEFGVEFAGTSHTALHDARATAGLLSLLLSDSPCLLRQIEDLPTVHWPEIPRSPFSPMTREKSKQLQVEPPSYLKRLMSRADLDVELLQRALEDRHIDELEGDTLVDLAIKWGLDRTRVLAIHRNFLLRLADRAIEDGVVTNAERQDLSLVARQLGLDRSCVGEALEEAERRREQLATSSRLEAEGGSGIDDLSGKTVCFTGEFQCRCGGLPVTREIASVFAASKGMIVVESVTKKLDLLVVADPHTQSGKANKARRYGIRIMHERVLWNNLGIKAE
jgi:DNA polymerase-3 subunit epsilon